MSLSGCPSASRSGSFASSSGSEEGCWENSCSRTCSLVKRAWCDVTWSGRVAHGEWDTGFSVDLMYPPRLQLESGVGLTDPTVQHHSALSGGLHDPPGESRMTIHWSQLHPGELDNDSPWVTLTLTLTGWSHARTHTHSGSIPPKHNTRVKQKKKDNWKRKIQKH